MSIRSEIIAQPSALWVAVHPACPVLVHPLMALEQLPGERSVSVGRALWPLVDAWHPGQVEVLPIPLVPPFRQLVTAILIAVGGPSQATAFADLMVSIGDRSAVIRGHPCTAGKPGGQHC